MMDQDIVVFSFFWGGLCAFVCVLFLLLLLQPLFFINIIPQGIFFNLKHPALSPLEKKFFLFISSHTQFFFQCFPSSLFLRRKGSRMGVWCGNGKKTHLIIFFVNEKKVFFQFANGGVGACACAARMVLTFFSCFFFLFDQCRFWVIAFRQFTHPRPPSSHALFSPNLWSTRRIIIIYCTVCETQKCQNSWRRRLACN